MRNMTQRDAGAQAMDLIAVGQGSGDVALEDYEAASAAGPITPPAMAGLDELLHKLKLDDADHNPFVSEAPVREPRVAGCTRARCCKYLGCVGCACTARHVGCLAWVYAPADR